MGGCGWPHARSWALLSLLDETTTATILLLLPLSCRCCSRVVPMLHCCRAIPLARLHCVTLQLRVFLRHFLLSREPLSRAARLMTVLVVSCVLSCCILMIAFLKVHDIDVLVAPAFQRHHNQSLRGPLAPAVPTVLVAPWVLPPPCTRRFTTQRYSKTFGIPKKKLRKRYF